MQGRPQDTIDVHAAPKDSALVVDVLKAVATPLTGDAFLHNLVQQLGSLFQAETTFIAHRTDPDGTKVRGLAAWKDGERKEAWEFDLKNNPCHLVYDGDPVFLPCDVAGDFSGKKDSGYQSFVGYPLHGRDGSVMGHIAVYSSKVLAEGEDWVSLCGLFADRAEAELQRQELENERERTIRTLEELSQQKNEFMSIAAHDLRSPLGAVRGIAEMLGRTEIERERQQSLLSNIVLAADRMVELVNNYLDYAAIEAGSLKIRKEDRDVSSLVEERVTLRRLIAAERDIGIKVTCPAGVSCHIDADRIGQVIDNILDNAIKFSPVGGTILVVVSEVDNAEKVSISVEDEGPGVPEEIKSRMFGAFETTGDDDTAGNRRTGKSFGLGLMISKRVVDAHDGLIEVGKSAAGGAKMTVTLPTGDYPHSEKTHAE